MVNKHKCKMIGCIYSELSHKFYAECKCEKRFKKIVSIYPKEAGSSRGRVPVHGAGVASARLYMGLCMSLMSELCSRVTGPCYASRGRNVH